MTLFKHCACICKKVAAFKVTTHNVVESDSYSVYICIMFPEELYLYENKCPKKV